MSEPPLDPMDDLQAEMTVEAAAERLDITVGHVRELITNGVLASRTDGQRQWVSASDVARFQARRQRQRKAIEEISRLVDESPGGWDS